MTTANPGPGTDRVRVVEPAPTPDHDAPEPGSTAATLPTTAPPPAAGTVPLGSGLVGWHGRPLVPGAGVGGRPGLLGPDGRSLTPLGDEEQPLRRLVGWHGRPLSPSTGTVQSDPALTAAAADHADPAGSRPARRESLAEAAAAVVAAAEAFAAAAARERAVAASDRDLEAAVGVGDEAVRLVQAGMLGVTREAVFRGLPKENGYSTHDWLDLHAPLLARVNRAAITTVANGLGHPDPGTRDAHAQLEPDLETGRLGLHRARRFLLGLGRVRPHVSDELYAHDVSLLLPLALDGSEKDLEQAVAGLISVAVPVQDREAAATAAYDSRCVEEQKIKSEQLGIDLYEVRIRCEAEGAAILQALFASPLAAPSPDPQTGEPDPRTPGQRRYDALITAITRGLSAPAGAPGTQKATVVVTMTLDQLLGASDLPTTTATGQAFTPEEARRAACDAGIIPVVLGSRSQVLDVGRASRCATAAQVTALRVRDGGCTYPGCSTPAGWCDAHHLVHWSQGGKTDLDNLALLCRRHHTLVHHTHPGWRLEHPPPAPPDTKTGRTPKNPKTTRASRIHWNL